MRWFASILLVMLASARAHAGELPPCDPVPTESTQVARADLVVTAVASARTQRRPHHGLRTRFAVTSTLRGARPPKTITVTDCDDWKCSAGRFTRGQAVVLLLRATGRAGQYELLGPSCSGGFQASWLDDRADDPHVQAVRAAAAP